MEQIEAPKWNDCPEVPEEYGPPAQNLRELVEHITVAHKALQGCQDFTDRTDIQVYSEADNKRLDLHGNSSLSMVLFNGTVIPVMRALYSAVMLSDVIQDQQNSDGFYHDLQNCLRFVSPTLISGKTIGNRQYVTPEGEVKKYDDSEWPYLSDVQGFIESLNKWHRQSEIYDFPLHRFNNPMKNDIGILLENKQLLFNDSDAANSRAKEIKRAMKAQKIPEDFCKLVHKSGKNVVLEYEGKVLFREQP